MRAPFSKVTRGKERKERVRKIDALLQRNLLRWVSKLPIKIKPIILLIKEKRKCFEYLKFILIRKIAGSALINIKFSDY